MQITFTSSSGKKICPAFAYPKFALPNKLTSSYLDINTGYGNMLIKKVCFEGVCLLCCEGCVSQPCRINFQSNRFCYRMIFVLDGSLNVTSSDRELQLQRNDYYSFYADKTEAELSFEAMVNTFMICLTRDFVCRFLEDSVLEKLLKLQEPASLAKASNRSCNRLRLLVQQIMQGNHNEYVTRIFLASKILEILSLQVEKLENKPEIPVDFNSRDVERLHQAKNIVADNLKTPYSLIELARITGLNDFKLKKGFKSLFGNTVFGFLAEVRMEKAHQLLQNGQSVNEVSELIGYKNAHHFSAAFKKRYNVLPSRIGKS